MLHLLCCPDALLFKVNPFFKNFDVICKKKAHNYSDDPCFDPPMQQSLRKTSMESYFGEKYDPSGQKC